jgi:hypothetical protein
LSEPSIATPLDGAAGGRGAHGPATDVRGGVEVGASDTPQARTPATASKPRASQAKTSLRRISADWSSLAIPGRPLLVNGDRCITGETAITGDISRAEACALAAVDATNTVATAVGAAKAVTSAAAALEETGQVCRNSFTAETRVLMADGSTKAIADVRIGDHVLATDPATGTTNAHEVVDLITGEGEKHLVDVEVKTKDGVRTIVATRGIRSGSTIKAAGSGPMSYDRVMNSSVPTEPSSRWSVQGNIPSSSRSTTSLLKVSTPITSLPATRLCWFTTLAGRPRRTRSTSVMAILDMSILGRVRMISKSMSTKAGPRWEYLVRKVSSQSTDYRLTSKYLKAYSTG